MGSVRDKQLQKGFGLSSPVVSLESKPTILEYRINKSTHSKAPCRCLPSVTEKLPTKSIPSDDVSVCHYRCLSLSRMPHLGSQSSNCSMGSTEEEKEGGEGRGEEDDDEEKEEEEFIQNLTRAENDDEEEKLCGFYKNTRQSLTLLRARRRPRATASLAHDTLLMHNQPPTISRPTSPSSLQTDVSLWNDAQEDAGTALSNSKPLWMSDDLVLTLLQHRQGHPMCLFFPRASRRHQIPCCMSRLTRWGMRCRSCLILHPPK